MRICYILSARVKQSNKQKKENILKNKRMRKQNNARLGEKKYSDKLSRFRNDVKEFSEKFGGVKQSKKGFKKPITRKEKRKFERQLKHAKNLAFNKKEKVTEKII